MFGAHFAYILGVDKRTAAPMVRQGAAKGCPHDNTTSRHSWVSPSCDFAIHSQKKRFLESACVLDEILNDLGLTYSFLSESAF